MYYAEQATSCMNYYRSATKKMEELMKVGDIVETRTRRSSEETAKLVKEAKKMIAEGKTPYAASKTVGINPSSIYKHL